MLKKVLILLVILSITFLQKEADAEDFFVGAKDLTKNTPRARKITVDYNIKAYHNNILGNKDQSFLTLGGSLVGNLVLRNKERLKGKYDFEWIFHTRFTDDIQIDRRSPHTQKVFVRLTQPNIFEARFGDIYSNFSQYSLVRSLEGFDVWRKSSLGEKGYFKINTVAARHYRAIAPNRFARYTTGFRLEGATDPNRILSINIVKTWDDSGSIDKEEADPTAIDNWVYSIDITLRRLRLWRIKDINIKTELASSWYDSGVKDDSAERDNAYKFDISGRLKELFLDYNFEKVGPKFNSLSGSASADQELFRINSRYIFSPKFSIKGSYTQYHNNLKNTQNTTTYTKIPTVSLSLVPIAKLPTLSCDLSYRRTTRKSTDNTTHRYQQSSTANINYSRRKLYVNVSGDYTEAVDKVNSDNDSHLNTESLGIGFRGIRINEDITFSPSLNYSIQSEKMHSVNGTNVYQNLGLGFNTAYRKDTSLGVSYQLSKSDRTADLTDSTRGNLKIEFTFRPKHKQDTIIALRYIDRNNNYEDKSREYQERALESEVKFRF